MATFIKTQYLQHFPPFKLALRGTDTAQAGTDVAQAGTDVAQAGTDMAQTGTKSMA